MLIGTTLHVTGYVLRGLAAAAGSVPMLALGTVICAIGTGPMAVPVNTFSADAVDYGEWNSGKRIEGIGSSVMSVGTRLANGIAGGSVGWVLALTGYVADQTQTAAANTGIVSLFAWVPALLVVIIMILMSIFYHYDDEVEGVLSDPEAREKWMQDLCAEQFESGCVGNTFPSTNSLHNAAERQRMIDQKRFVFAPPTMAGPDGNGGPIDGAAGWGDVATILPWTMYLCYGDRQILENQYDSAKKWVEYCRRNARKANPLYKDQPAYSSYTDGICDAEYIYDTHFHWGEWMEPDAAENGGRMPSIRRRWQRKAIPL